MSRKFAKYEIIFRSFNTEVTAEEEKLPKLGILVPSMQAHHISDVLLDWWLKTTPHCYCSSHYWLIAKLLLLLKQKSDGNSIKNVKSSISQDDISATLLCHTNQCAKETNQSVLPSSQVAQMRCIFVILVPTPLSKPLSHSVFCAEKRSTRLKNFQSFWVTLQLKNPMVSGHIRFAKEFPAMRSIFVRLFKALPALHLDPFA